MRPRPHWIASLRLRRELGDAIGERNTLRSLGLLRWHQGRDREALACIEAALAIDRERGDLEALVSDLANLGNVHKGMGEHGRAREILQEALRLSDRLEVGTEAGPGNDLSHKRPYILHNLANVYRELGDEESALEYLAQARALTAEKRLPIQLSYHFTSTAHIYLRQGRVEESLTLYREAVELTRKAKFVPGLAQALRFLGEVLLGIGRDDEALCAAGRVRGTLRPAARSGDGGAPLERGGRAPGTERRSPVGAGGVGKGARAARPHRRPPSGARRAGGARPGGPALSPRALSRARLLRGGARPRRAPRRPVRGGAAQERNGHHRMGARTVQRGPRAIRGGPPDVPGAGPHRRRRRHARQPRRHPGCDGPEGRGAQVSGGGLRPPPGRGRSGRRGEGARRAVGRAPASR